MTHHELLLEILNKIGIRKKRYLAKKIGYTTQQLYRWINTGDSLILSLRALQQLYTVASEIGIEVNINDLIYITWEKNIK